MFKKIALTALLSGLIFQAQAETLTVVSFGGTNKDAQDKAFYKPFEAAKLGTIDPGEYNGEMARIRAMVKPVKWVGTWSKLKALSWCAAVTKGCSNRWTGAS